MKNTRRISPVLVIAMFAVPLALLSPALFATVLSGTAASVPDRITQPIDEARLVRLERNTHPNARPEFDKGPVDDSMPMEKIILLLRRSAG